MGDRRIPMLEIGLPTVAAGLGLALLGAWVNVWFAPTGIAPRNLETGKPKVAPKPAAQAPDAPVAAAAAPSAPIASGASVVEMPGSWPSFRGPNGDNVAPPEVKVPANTNGLGLAWKVALGEGYAAPVIHAGRVYVLDYDVTRREDVLRCLALADGKEVWRTAYAADIKRNHGISRTVPATDGKVVVSLGPKGHVLCADAITGERKWFIDLVAEYGTTIPEWYAGQCPIIDGDRVILAPAGTSLVVAIDIATGKPVWKTPNPMAWTMTHSSLAKMGDQYIYCGSGGVAGISAKDGKLLWSTTEWTVNTATVPTPVPVGGGKVFLCGGYNAGSMMLQVSGTSAKPLFRLESSVFGSDQQTPVLYKDHLYGVAPNGELVCLDLSGKRLWGSGTAAKFGLGAYMIADGKILALNDHGDLTIAEASTAGFKPYGKVKVLTGRESWGPMAVAGDRLLVRDFDSLVCIRLGGS